MQDLTWRQTLNYLLLSNCKCFSIQNVDSLVVALLPCFYSSLVKPSTIQTSANYSDFQPQQNSEPQRSHWILMSHTHQSVQAVIDMHFKIVGQNGELVFRKITKMICIYQVISHCVQITGFGQNNRQITRKPNAGRTCQLKTWDLFILLLTVDSML